MNIPWLKTIEDGWLLRVEQGRVPHAIMLFGAPGTGKRNLAAWIAGERLGLNDTDSGSQYPLDVAEHPDLRWIKPAEDKQSIGIEQIRGLVADLSLTSYKSGGKVAVVEPANVMTSNAANSLLKTLEEPAGDALLILVVDRMGHLPGTILSRCQRINVPIPGEVDGLAWLNHLHPSTSAQDALRLVGGAPLAAVDAAEQLEQSESMRGEFLALATNRASPIDVAARWASLDSDFWLEWLYRTVQRCIRRAICQDSRNNDSVLPESVLDRIDSRNLFCYLDTINRLRGQAAGSFNVQLTLESLLIDWAGGLKDCHRSYHPGELLPVVN